MHFSNEFIFFTLFIIFTILVTLFDLGIFSGKKAKIVNFKEAAFWSVVWVAISLLFFFFLKHFGYLVHDISDASHLQTVRDTYYKSLKLGTDHAENLRLFQNNMSLEYITGYLVEKSLSVDNIFVFILIFNSFRVPKKNYKTVLVWGILGSVILRFVFIFLGSTLIQRFEWILLIFGGFLVYTGVKILFTKDEDEKEIDTKNHVAVKLVSKYFNVYEKYVADHFIIKHKYKNNRFFVTPLFLVIVVIAFTDVIFAVDSIPAIFSITKDPYIVFFSNVFAIMGLRSMFFLLVNIIDKFHHLKYGLGVLLTYVGVKMLAHTWLEKIGFTSMHSLIVILVILTVSIISSIIFAKKTEEI
ncbi:MAG: TerC/Alx family metal homeostasis membrane protein [Cytophagaceae bacterium]|nr:TerC/Alx family metal homeostasis membrane protein [Cytophagaceae bacterium]MBK9510020.1 TerC/Alx family metal homeostasis membrane protein [Cytophagaceae bacterium]MBK9933560.1 TerC/Alx family metal homeostasis membrane protein [Cytophagaceae bacterium]MBL0302726.1 TerC/Alx family metal homeostasis membrane protein [Cytophagaceae bacterium]MBL0325549.1 TerC/Alx family metal homeostasis membrane protein [Cytophagaceae bacterium]